MSRGMNTAYRMDECDYSFERKLVLIEGGRHHAKARTVHSASSRSHIAAFLCALALACAFGATLAGIHATRVHNRLVACDTCEVRVLPGQTMWSLAQEHGVEGVSESELVSWIRDANGLDSALLMPGQLLVVPAQSHT